MRIALIIALLFVVVVIGMETYQFRVEGNRLEEDLVNSLNKLDMAKKEAASLEENIKYYEKSENLEKEMRARFNYRGNGEKLLIVVPKQGSSTIE